jgi:hypothetical protein
VSTPTDPTPDGEPVDDRIALVTSVGPLDPVVALLRELLHVASAVRATAVVAAAGGAEPAGGAGARRGPHPGAPRPRRPALPPPRGRPR